MPPSKIQHEEPDHFMRPKALNYGARTRPRRRKHIDHQEDQDYDSQIEERSEEYVVPPEKVSEKSQEINDSNDENSDNQVEIETTPRKPSHRKKAKVLKSSEDRDDDVVVEKPRRKSRKNQEKHLSRGKISSYNGIRLVKQRGRLHLKSRFQSPNFA